MALEKFLPLLVAIAVSCLQLTAAAPSLSPTLVIKLNKEPVNVLVSLTERTDSILSSVQTQSFPSRADRINAVVNALRQFTSESQRPVVDLLLHEQRTSTKGFTFEPLWITNKIMIRKADLDTVLKLVALPSVSSVDEEEMFPIDPPLDFHEFTPEELAQLDEDEIQWGVAMIQAPRIWSQGNRGQGVVVSHIDTGVRVSHESVASNYRGDYGWYDPVDGTPLPFDDIGHGTHTLSTIVGTTRNIGVAPGATWSSCRGCFSQFCLQFDLLACGQWVTCPTLADGTAKDCSKAPHIVSNSWSGSRGNDWFRETVQGMKAAGIIPLFSAGNSGPSCGSVASPGDYDNLITAGSTDSYNLLSNFSGVGPSPFGGGVKPDVVGPGSNVFAAYGTSDTSYASMSGTSMACPHVAGTVAMMLKEDPTLTYEEVKSILASGAVSISPRGQSCDGIPDSKYPNHHAGSGRIDAVNSVNTTRKLYSSKL